MRDHIGGYSFSFTQPYPTYIWSLQPQQWVYENESMMAAIESSLETMESYPDAEKIIAKISSR